jgi:hypothetical protein
MTLPPEHPTAVAFLDESGVIARSRFFAVGLLKLPEPELLTRRVQKLRDRHHWYREFHWTDVTSGALPIYREVLSVPAALGDARFACFVADRDAFDPVARFGSPWTAYEHLATQLLLGNIRPDELVSVIADNYSTPHGVRFERDVRRDVNSRLGRCAVPSLVRLDSRSTDALQVVDLLTAAVAFEFQQQAGLAGRRTPKARLLEHTKGCFGVEAFTDVPLGDAYAQVAVRVYGEGATWATDHDLDAGLRARAVAALPS